MDVFQRETLFTQVNGIFAIHFFELHFTTFRNINIQYLSSCDIDSTNIKNICIRNLFYCQNSGLGRINLRIKPKFVDTFLAPILDHV